MMSYELCSCPWGFWGVVLGLQLLEGIGVELVFGVVAVEGMDMGGVLGNLGSVALTVSLSAVGRCSP